MSAEQTQPTWKSAHEPKTDSRARRRKDVRLGVGVAVWLGCLQCAWLAQGEPPPKNAAAGAARAPIQFVDVAAGSRHTCGVTTRGEVYCWGSNQQGQLGDGAPLFVPRPRRFPSLQGAERVWAGAFETCVLVKGGRVHCWGSSRKPLVLFENAVEVALGGLVPCARLATGSVECVDYRANRMRRFEQGPKAKSLVGSSAETCALLENGSVWCWHASEARPRERRDLQGATRLAFAHSTLCGLFGDGTVRCRPPFRPKDGLALSAPKDKQWNDSQEVVALRNARELSATPSVACAALPEGLRCWGPAPKGATRRPGDPSWTVDAATGGGTRRPLGSPTRLVAGAGHHCALVAGTISCWGHNEYGQVGSGRAGLTLDTDSPQEVHGLPPITSVVAAATRSCALDAQGQLYCWGEPFSPQSEGFAIGPAPTPIKHFGRHDNVALGEQFLCTLEGGAPSCWGAAPDVRGPEASAPARGMRIATPPLTTLVAGSNYACALVAGGRAFCWGMGDEGELGIKTTEEGQASAMLPMRRVAEVVLSGGTTCVRTTEGSVQCVGAPTLLSEESGRARPHMPRRIGGLPKAKALYGAHGGLCVVDGGGKATCWGPSAPGTSGVSNGSELVQVEGPTHIESIAMGMRHACALTRDRQLWCWDQEPTGKVAPAGKGQPRLVSTRGVQGAWTHIASGRAHVCARTDAGRVYCWGNNFDGQLGTGEAGKSVRLDLATPIDLSGR